MLNQTVIEELKLRNNIEDVISSYVQLSRAGRNMKGLCPFHSEKTPSFTVHPGEGFFYCFGCGSGGDVITFIMKAENLSYPDALEFLAARAGITLPSYKDARESGGVERSDVLSMNREAAKYFHACLMDPKTPEGLKYLKEKRGFSTALIRHFGMGYAPGGWGLCNHLKSKGYSYEQMLAANLILKSKKKENTYYDVFHDRVMVPILDAGGNVVAFGGRLMGDGQPKYLNSGDTPAFRKSKTLFALNFAKDHCTQRLILCEGYMDAIALHGAGFPQAVATLGTSMTPEHARMMKRYTKSVVICYDTDAAGQAAADKAFRLLAEVGLDARILRVKDAKDPDEFIKKSGAHAFSRLIDESKSRFEFKLERILEQHDPRMTDEKVKALDQITALIAEYPSSVERELYISSVAKRFEVSPGALSSDVERIIRQNTRKQKKDFSSDVMRKTEGYSDRVNPQVMGNVAAARAEEALLGLMLLKDDIAQKAVAEELVCEKDFVTDFNRKVFLAIKELAKAGAAIDPGMLGEQFSPDEMGRITKMRLVRSELSDNRFEVFEECVRRLKDSKKTENTAEDILAILEKKRKRN